MTQFSEIRKVAERYVRKFTERCVTLYQGTTDAMAAIDPNLKANVVRKRKEELEVANLSNKVYGSTFTNVGDSLAAPAVDDGAAEAGKQAFNKKKKKPLTAPPGDKA